MLAPIAERNEKFASMSRMEQRMEIARDVLQQIWSGQMEPTKGTFVEKRWNEDSCTVCALGALALSCFNGKAVGRGRETLHELLSPYFDSDELSTIEGAFEGWYEFYISRLVGPIGATYMEMLPSDYRLTVIMLNVIRNKGKFVKEQIPWYIP